MRRFLLAASAAFFVSCGGVIHQEFSRPYNACRETIVDANSTRRRQHDVGTVVGETETQGVVTYHFQSSYYDGLVIDVVRVNRRCKLVLGQTGVLPASERGPEQPPTPIWESIPERKGRNDD